MHLVRHSGRRTLVPLFALVLLSCGPGPTTTSSSRSTGPSLLVALHRSGGLAGTDDRLTIDGEGHVALVQSRPPVQRSSELAGDESDALRRQLAAVDAKAIRTTKANPQAADSFVYDLDIKGGHLTFDDTTVPPTLRPLLDQLTAILGRLAR